MVRFIVLCLCLAACASPSPRFQGATPTRVSVAGMDFAVFRSGAEVEAIRTNAMPVPRQRDVFRNAIAAIEQATGCTLRPRSMTGDAAIIRAAVDCP